MLSICRFYTPPPLFWLIHGASFNDIEELPWQSISICNLDGKEGEEGEEEEVCYRTVREIESKGF